MVIKNKLFLWMVFLSIPFSASASWYSPLVSPILSFVEKTEPVKIAKHVGTGAAIGTGTVTVACVLKGGIPSMLNSKGTIALFGLLGGACGYAVYRFNRLESTQEQLLKGQEKIQTALNELKTSTAVSFAHIEDLLKQLPEINKNALQSTLQSMKTRLAVAVISKKTQTPEMIGLRNDIADLEKEIKALVDAEKGQALQEQSNQTVPVIPAAATTEGQQVVPTAADFSVVPQGQVNTNVPDQTGKQGLFANGIKSIRSLFAWGRG